MKGGGGGGGGGLAMEPSYTGFPISTLKIVVDCLRVSLLGIPAALMIVAKEVCGKSMTLPNNPQPHILKHNTN